MSKDAIVTRRRGRAPRSVGRPRNSGAASKDGAQKEILKAASALFSTKGFAGTTMAEIADTVGIRGPSLYYHFEIKPDILREIAKTGLNECLAIADQIISDPSLAPAARIYKLVYECILYLCSSEYEFTCLFDSALAEKEFDDIIELKKTWESVFQRFLQSAAESNQLQIEDVPLTTHTMRGLFAWSIRDQDGVGEIETKAIARHVADFALRSLLEDNRELEQIHAQIDASESFGTAV